MDLEPDLFIVHTDRDPLQVRMFESVRGWATRTGLRTVVYEDWDWMTTPHRPENALGLPSEDPWHFMAEVDTGSLHGFWRRCGVTLILESDPDKEPTRGVARELRELWEVEQVGPPPATVIAATVGARLSQAVSDLARAHTLLDTPEDPEVLVLIALAWFVSRLERSGVEGLELLDRAEMRGAILGPVRFYGPHWRAMRVGISGPLAPVASWWPQSGRLRESMHARGGVRGKALDVLFETVAEHLVGDS